jgi:hypothetical protein
MRRPRIDFCSFFTVVSFFKRRRAGANEDDLVMSWMKIPQLRLGVGYGTDRYRPA